MGMTTRREFLALAAGTAGYFGARPAWGADVAAVEPYEMVARTDRARILAAANRYLSEEPITVIASHSERSKGGRHDYFSEGDYWWPDEKIRMALTFGVMASPILTTSTIIARLWCGSALSFRRLQPRGS